MSMSVQPFGTQTQPISVLLVDGHRTVAGAVALAISGETDLDCLATAHTAAEALILAERLLPDVVITEVDLLDGDGLTAAARMIVSRPETRVVVLTAEVDRSLLQRAVSAGACALVAKDATLVELVHAVGTAPRDGFMVAPSLVKKLMAGPVKPHPIDAVFTRREHDVLHELADGSDARVTARALGISLPTCRGYIKSILVKLDAHTQLEAVVIAHRRGLVRVGAYHRARVAARSV